MDLDVLMITYQSPERTRLSLERLLSVAEEHSFRVWLWHNGTHAETLDVVLSAASHPNVHRFHHSVENVKLRDPTNWLLSEARGRYFSKIDDDNVVPFEWPGRLIDAHEDEPRLGVLGSWRFQDEDYCEELAASKIQSFRGHRVLRNLWVEGSCFVMKRACVERQGLIAAGQSFPQYCQALARRGWINGYLVPFVRYVNLDDPREPLSLIRTDADLAARLPLSAKANGVTTVAQWADHLHRSARGVQAAEYELKHWRGWRLWVKRIKRRTRRLRGDGRMW